MSESVEYWLCLDLSTPAGTLAVQRARPTSVETLAETALGVEGSHSETLLGALANSLGYAGIGLDRLDRYLTSSGPGSFTGLRIALASLKAFAFSRQKPFETLSGSEARALAWAQSRSDLAPRDEIAVVSAVSRDRYARAVLVFTAARGLVLREETVCSEAELLASKARITLLDEKTPAAKVAGDSLLFPLHARHLGQALSRAATRRTHADLPAWIQATPHYFGETKYRTTF